MLSTPLFCQYFIGVAFSCFVLFSCTSVFGAWNQYPHVTRRLALQLVLLFNSWLRRRPLLLKAIPVVLTMPFLSEPKLRADPVSIDSALDCLVSGQSIGINGGKGEKISQAASNGKDPNIVDWNSPADPANPRNWTRGAKLTHVLLVSTFTLYS